MTAGQEGGAHAEAVRRLASAMLRTALVPALVTIAAGAVLAGILAGGAGVRGALVGGAVALASSLATIVMMRWSAPFPVMVAMAVAIGGYVVKLLALLLVMVALGGIEGLHVNALAFTFLAVVLVWAVADVVAFRRTKIPTLVIGE